MRVRELAPDDPARPVDKPAGDARWAIDLAKAAIAAVDAEVSAG